MPPAQLKIFVFGWHLYAARINVGRSFWAIANASKVSFGNLIPSGLRLSRTTTPNGTPPYITGNAHKERGKILPRSRHFCTVSGRIFVLSAYLWTLYSPVSCDTSGRSPA